MRPLCMLPLLLTLAASATAQMNFFEQLFNQGGGQQHQQQQQQNVASDSEWYQRTYDSGIPSPSIMSPFQTLTHGPKLPSTYLTAMVRNS